MEFDLLVHDTTLVTMDAQRRVLRHATVGIDRGRIRVICLAHEAGGFTAAKTVDGTGWLALPGIIDTHADALVKTREAVQKFHGLNGGLNLCYPTPSGVGYREGLDRDELIRQNAAMKAIADEFGVPIHGHAYRGDVQYAFEHFDILGPHLSLAHVTGISNEEIRILAETGTHVLSGPMTNAYINARCPVVELLDAGVNVAFCTDASAPNRSYDLFEKLRIGLWLHRSHFRDADVLTAGKALEMITIDAAKALGLDADLGSLEEGKKADLILVDLQKPHLYPVWQEPLRLVYQASGHDVDTVIVDGQILMGKRRVPAVDETAILATVQAGLKRCSTVPVSGKAPGCRRASGKARAINPESMEEDK